MLRYPYLGSNQQLRLVQPSLRLVGLLARKMQGTFTLKVQFHENRNGVNNNMIENHLAIITL